MTPDLTTIERARELVLSRTERTASERVPLREANGRVLAAPVTAADDIPGFDNSAMDGFAVRAEDTTAAPVELRVVGESRAGHPADRGAGPSEAIAISTGAMIPPGADAVVRVEDTDREGEAVRIAVAVEVGTAVRRAGEDVIAGAALLEPGVTLGAAEIGALAAVGRGDVECARRPSLAMLVTGDELVEPGRPLGPGQIRNSNAYAVPPLALDAGAEMVDVGMAGDDRDATRAALGAGDRRGRRGRRQRRRLGRRARPRPPGAGVARSRAGVLGRLAAPRQADLLRGRRRGGRWSSACRATRSRRWSRSCSSRARRSSRCRAPIPTRIASSPASTATTRRSRGGRRRSGSACGPETSGWVATPTGPQGSHVLTSMLGADGLAFAPTGASVVRAGETIEVELLRR